jgi:hypothetical protein
MCVLDDSQFMRALSIIREKIIPILSQNPLLTFDIKATDKSFSVGFSSYPNVKG